MKTSNYVDNCFIAIFALLAVALAVTMGVGLYYTL